MTQINWARMAEPQADGYDTDVTLSLAQRQRRKIGDARAFCGSQVAIRPAVEGGMLCDTLLAADVHHPNLDTGAALLARWPQGYNQFQRLIDSVIPYTDPTQAAMGEWSLGSSSNSFEEDFGAIHTTVDDAFGFAQAMVHEMAHQKLRALGVSEESPQRLITHDGVVLFHNQYTFIYVTALDLEMWAGSRSDAEGQRILMLLARNVPRMEVGYEQISDQTATDEAGKQFVAGFQNWSRNVLARGRRVLEANGYGST